MREGSAFFICFRQQNIFFLLAKARKRKTGKNKASAAKQQIHIFWLAQLKVQSNQGHPSSGIWDGTFQAHFSLSLMLKMYWYVISNSLLSFQDTPKLIALPWGRPRWPDCCLSVHKLQSIHKFVLLTYLISTPLWFLVIASLMKPVNSIVL